MKRNPKRQIVAPDALSANDREKLAKECVYKGSPYHKRSPSDYNLDPPSGARKGATLCDVDRAIEKTEAQALLRKGFKQSMFSPLLLGTSSIWPKNVWAVTKDNEVFEAQLENEVLGHYHGYPLQLDDDFRRVVLTEWENRTQCR